MKKKVLGIIMVSILAILFIAKIEFSNDAKSGINFENIEALAQLEYEYPDGFPYSSICNVSISKHKRCKVEIIICQGGGNGCNSKKCSQHK